jgi:hypothetical protein
MNKILFFYTIIICTCLISCSNLRNCSIGHVSSPLQNDINDKRSIEEIVTSIDLCNEIKITFIINAEHNEDVYLIQKYFHCPRANQIESFKNINVPFEYSHYLPVNIEGPWLLSYLIPSEKINPYSDLLDVKNKVVKRFPEKLNVFNPEKGYLILFSSNRWYLNDSSIHSFYNHDDFVSFLSPNLYAYEQGIRLLWQRYRDNIYLNFDSITLHSIKTENEEILISNKSSQIFLIYNLKTKYLHKHIKLEMKNGGNLQKSYFSLILWDMYQPQDFIIANNFGRVRSMKFYSPLKDRNYKVKFNIDYPFCFKVRKTIFP